MRSLVAIVGLGLLGAGLAGCVSQGYPAYETAEPAAYYSAYGYYGAPPVYQVYPARPYYGHWHSDPWAGQHGHDAHHQGRYNAHDGYRGYGPRR